MIEFLLIGMFLYFLHRLIKKIGKSFPLFELTALLYLLQYCIAPILEYKFGELGSMKIPIEEYLPFATFATLAFIAGLFVYRPKINLYRININPQIASKIGRTFVVTSFVSSFAILLLPESLSATFNFFVLLKLPGLFSLIFSNKKLDKFLVKIILFEVAISSILSGVLIQFIVISIFTSMFYSIRYNISNKLKISIILIGVLFLTVYQGVKADYRELVWEKKVSVTEKLFLITELIDFNSFKAVVNSDISNNESVIKTIHRLNQGWQTSMVMYQVPRRVPFEYGKTLAIDIFSSIAPRFLYPNKRTVNDYKHFNYYTGYNLNSKTAMTIGVIGDIYINFGLFGSIFALFFLGMFFSWFFNWFFRKFIYSNPINLIWLPFLFSYLIRPGNELYMVLNHLIKGLFVCLIVIKLIYPFLIKSITTKSKV